MYYWPLPVMPSHLAYATLGCDEGGLAHAAAADRDVTREFVCTAALTVRQLWRQRPAVSACNKQLATPYQLFTWAHNPLHGSKGADCWQLHAKMHCRAPSFHGVCRSGHVGAIAQGMLVDMHPAWSEMNATKHMQPCRLDDGW